MRPSQETCMASFHNGLQRRLHCGRRSNIQGKLRTRKPVPTRSGEAKKNIEFEGNFNRKEFCIGLFLEAPHNSGRQNPTTVFLCGDVSKRRFFLTPSKKETLREVSPLISAVCRAQ